MASPQTMAEFLTDVYLPRNPQVGANAAVQYASICRKFDEWSDGKLSLRSLTIETLSDFLQAVRATGRSERTVNNHRAILLTLWRYAYEMELKPKPPPTKRQLPKLREPKRHPNAFTLPQMKKLKEACLEAKALPRLAGLRCRHGSGDGIPTPRWTGRHWWALCSLIWDTGHRVSALLSVPKAALGDDGYLTIPAEMTKHNMDMVHKLKDSTIALLDSLPAEDLLLKWPYTKRMLWVCFRRDVLIPSGLPCGPRHMFHCLRRTSASHLWAMTDNVWEVASHLGHTRIGTTMGYLDPQFAAKKKAAAKLLPEI